MIRHGRKIYRAVDPGQLSRYLRSQGWRADDVEPGRSATYRRVVRNQSVELLVPLDRNLADYVHRLADLLRTLEVVENRSREQILYDIGSLSSDIIRARVGLPQSTDRIRLAHGVDLIAGMHELLQAAAFSTLVNRAVLPPKKPKEVTEYLHSVQLGTLEAGSFVLAVHSPLPSQTMPLPDLDVEPEDPYPRRVVKTLMSVTRTTARAAEVALARDTLDPFEETIALGVNANICEALASMLDAAGRGPLWIKPTWSSRLDAGERFRRAAVRVEPHLTPYIREAGEHFRKSAPDEDFLITGFVTKLEGEPKIISRITVQGEVGEGKLGKVAIDLAEADYKLAIEAHRDRRPVTCVGELSRSGNRYALNNPREFGLYADDEDDLADQEWQED